MMNAVLGFNKRGFVDWIIDNYVKHNIHSIRKAAEITRGEGGGGGGGGVIFKSRLKNKIIFLCSKKKIQMKACLIYVYRLE
jgi:hypothetical protein